MGDGTKENPFTRKDVLKKIKENGGKAEGLDLSGKRFEECVDLRGLNLEGVILKRAVFTPSLEMVLKGARLQGANLKRAQLQKAYLPAAELQRANLNMAQLQEANLVAARLEEASLVEAQLQEANLSGARLDRAWLYLAHLEGANLISAHLQKAHLEGANLRAADLSYANLKGATLADRQVTLAGAEFWSDTRLESAHWGNYILGEEEEANFYEAVGSYRRLKQWYINAGVADIAAKFYYREKEANRKSLKWYSRHRIALELLRALFGYGEHWERVFYWMALVIFGSAAAYCLSGELNLLYSLYFSVVSFTALGYGKWVDITPQGWVQALGAFQSFTGVFLMALLLVTFFRKWTR